MTFPPSNAHVWVNCAGAASLQHSRPLPRLDNQDDAAKQEGIAFHELCEQRLANAELTRSDCVGQLTSNHVLIDDEMWDASDVYIDDVRSVCPGEGLKVEEKIDLSVFIEGQFGYVDAYVFGQPSHTVTVWDAKYGHRLVDVRENWQLIMYAFGIAQKHRIEPNHAYKFDLRVVQPRGYHTDGPVRSWVISAAELYAYANMIHAAIADARQPNPNCTVGPWCDSCDARHACDALKRAVYAGADYVHSAVASDLHETALVLEYEMLKRFEQALKARLGGIEQQVIAEAYQGKIAGYTARPGVGRTRWTKDVPVTEVVMMGEMLGVDVRKPVELITPKQAEKLGIDQAVINAYTEKPQTGLKLEKVNYGEIFDEC